MLEIPYERQNSLLDSQARAHRTLQSRPSWPTEVRQPTESAVARILDDLEQRGGLKGSDVANIVNVSRPTVSRWKSGKASPPLATQTIIADLRYVVDRLSDFYTPSETRLWLHAKHPLLNNERAIDLIIADRTQEVLAVIERLDAGAYL
jgi:transcriptional regulator with XRE-family HTH domain